MLNNWEKRKIYHLIELLNLSKKNLTDDNTMEKILALFEKTSLCSNKTKSGKKGKLTKKQQEKQKLIKYMKIQRILNMLLNFIMPNFILALKIKT